MANSDLFDGEKYSDGLPKRVVGRVQCDAMDEHGTRCDLPAVFETVYYGDLSLERAPWIVTRLCDYHGKHASSNWEQNLSYSVWKEAKRKGLLKPKGTE